VCWSELSRVLASVLAFLVPRLVQTPVSALREGLSSQATLEQVSTLGDSEYSGTKSGDLSTEVCRVHVCSQDLRHSEGCLLV
jgi:hypothetical protein